MSIKNNKNDWTRIIRPSRKLFDLNIKEIWSYRELIVAFIWRDYVSYYKQTILGPLWYIIQPILISLTFTVIFGNIIGVSTDGLPDILFYMSGTIVWSYFSSCMVKTSNTFTGNANIFGKVYFPRIIIPISLLFSNLITFFVQFILFIFFMIYFYTKGFNINISLWFFMLPILLILMACLGLAVGLVISSLTTRYRDLQFLVTFGVQLIMYATTVIMPLSSVPEKYKWIILSNPMTPIIESFRLIFLGSGTVHILHIFYSISITLILLIFGLLIFNKIEQNFMDTV